MDLRRIAGWLIDLNGVLYVGEEAVEGAAKGLEWLRGTGRPCRFASNTTTRSADELAAKLQRLGFEIGSDELFTAPRAGADWLRFHNIRRCHFLVCDGVRGAEFAEFDGGGPGETGAVVIGDIGEAWDYQLIDEAFRHLEGGAKLLALHRSRVSQSPEGLQLDIGPFVAALECASGKDAVVVGKPSADFFETALRSLDCAPDEAAMIGDDLENDVGGAQRAGMKGVLVRTGKFREEQLAGSEVEPDLILDSLGRLASETDE